MKKQTKKPSKTALEPETIATKNMVAKCDLKIAERIMPIRGVQVMLDCDLAKLYGVEVKQLNRQVKRNSERFPSDFMFQLSEKESKILKCQFGTSSWGGARYRPYAFTENGIAMLSGVLRSPTAIAANIRIMRAFVAMRHALMSSAGVLQRLGTVEVKLIETDKRLDTVFDALDRGRLLPSGIIPANTEFDSIRQVSRLVESAKSEIVIINPQREGNQETPLAAALIPASICNLSLSHSPTFSFSHSHTPTIPHYIRLPPHPAPAHQATRIPAPAKKALRSL